LAAGGKVPEGVETIPYLKWYKVFNLDQLQQGLPEKLFFKGESLSFTEPEKDLAAEEFLGLTGANIRYMPYSENLYTILSGRQKANFYDPQADTIQLTLRSQFNEAQGFYRTAFHELGHWTGHKTRLSRDLSKPFGSPEYAKEELTAELFSAFSCANCGFSSQITNNAAYIQSWLTCLKDDKKFVFQASSKAQEAVRYTVELVASRLGQDVGLEAQIEEEA
jgi:antirestriction protein ArdC